MLFARALTHAAALLRRDRNSDELVGPWNLDPSQAWDGNDGQWSSFVMRVGHPDQLVRFLPSTVGAVNWVSYQSIACPQYIPVPPGTGNGRCDDSRGGLFNQNTSTSWIPNSLFNLGIDTNLGLDTSALFGYDTIQLGYSNTTTIPHQIVALNGNPRYWVGGLGLNPRPTNFTDFNNPQKSLLQTLKNNSLIPSLSYSYTAGAYYRYSKVLGSLTLGGYDASLLPPNPLTIGMGADDSRDLVVGIRSITSNATTNSLLPGGPILSLVESTFPFIWLPQDACKAFEDAFGLTYDLNSELYLLNRSAHDALLKQNPTITFEIGANVQGGQTEKITLPYSAFDQNVSYPWIPQSQTSTFYFPLQRATNDTQYTLGRTFLQEAYLSVDYESSTFSVTQRPWALNQQATARITTTYPQGYEADKGISAGAIAGIVVGIVAGISLFAGIGVWYFLRQRRQRRAQDAALAAAAAAQADEKDRKLEHGSDASGDRNSRQTANTEYYTAEPKLKMVDVGAANRANDRNTIHELSSPRQVHEAPNAADGEGGKAPHGELAAPGPGAGAWEADSNMRFELAGSDVPLGMSEKLGGAKLVGWDGRTAAHSGEAPDRLLSSRDTSRSPTVASRSPTVRSPGGASPR